MPRNVFMTKRPLNLVLLGLFEPSQELRDMHVFLKAAESLDGQLAEKARRLDDLYTLGTQDAKSFEAMLLDYTRLFLSPGSPPAKNYLTCWKDKLGDKILDEYLSYLGSRGFEVERDIKEPPEHIVPVLEIYVLLEPEEKAEFFERFLSKFILEWSLLLETEAKHEFYKELGRFFAEWSKWESKENGTIS